MDYGHKQLRLTRRRVALQHIGITIQAPPAYLTVPIDSEDYDFAQGVDFDLVGAFLECITKILCGWRLGAIFVYDGIACRLLI